MRPTLTEFEHLAGEAFDRATAALPEETMERLNLGLAVNPELRAAPEGDGSLTCVLGLFTSHPVLGNRVELYYGSFVEVHDDASRSRWESALDEVVRHELQHFLESLQGRRDLAVQETQARAEERLARGLARRAGLGDLWALFARTAPFLLLLMFAVWLVARSLVH